MGINDITGCHGKTESCRNPRFTSQFIIIPWLKIVLGVIQKGSCKVALSTHVVKELENRISFHNKSSLIIHIYTQILNYSSVLNV